MSRSNPGRLSFLLYSFLAVAVLSCGGRKASQPQAAGDSIPFSYSTLLNITDYDDYSVAEIRNPWKPGMLLHRYYLVPRGKKGVTSMDDGTVIEVPIERAAVFTTVHCALITEFGLGSKIAAVADSKYIKVPFIQRQIKEGRITDCGNGLNPVVEKIMDVKPEVILLSPFENSGGYGKTEEIGIPIIECAEYMETSPLARAEWMRFYGMLFGVKEKADSLFNVVDSCYQELRAKAKATGQGRSVIIDKVVGSVWYMPGGRSTIGRMIQDAGGQYVWAADNHSGSLALPFESVLEHAGTSDVWMLRYSSDHEWTYSELLSGHRGYDQLKASQTQQVYGCNVESSLFYEQSPFRPDYLLSDFIQILHPDIIGLPPLRYYYKLKE